MQSTDQIPEMAVDEGLSPKLRHAVASLVRAKAHVDWLAHDANLDLGLVTQNGLSPGEDGTSFFREVFPFYGRWIPSESDVVRKIPLELTVGNSWRWRPRHVDPVERSTLIEDFQQGEDFHDPAKVFWIVPLGLFLAHEGKNRVAFLRSEGETYYTALTSSYDYPAADRLLLVRVEGSHGDEWWAVLDRDEIEPLRHPEWALPVLDAYGVRTANGWPADFPSYIATREAVAYRSRKCTQHLNLPPISLNDVRAKEKKKVEIVSASFMDLQEVRLKRRVKQSLIALVAATMAALLFMDPKPHELSILSAGLGAVVLLSILLFVEVLVLPRHRIGPDSQ
ncbi:MAG: hypothetical protein FD131_3284 [Rhodocyclaceae bacterium]|nr:MAG: hypothetical protein FD131_3284 [Rhodocyclaceae bacterium]